MKTCKKGLHQYEEDKPCCPECRKKWKEENRDSVNARHRAWCAANRETKRASDKRSSDKNRDKQLVRMKKWREKNRVRHAELSRMWYTANRDRKLAKNKKWRDCNHSRFAELQREWRRSNPYPNHNVARGLGFESVKDAPARIIEAKRAQLKLGRLLKEIQK